MNYVEKTLRYFDAFGDKNIGALADMFADDVVLLDWNLNESGKTAVLTASSAIFSSAGELKVEPHTVVCGGTTVFAEITVTVDDISINVVDILVYDDFGKIKKISAYKR